MTRRQLKALALAAMVLNHVSAVFMPPGFLCDLFRVAGYFTAPVMCWMLADGFRRTSSRACYGRRLLLFAALSQVPFMAYFRTGVLNMVATLFLCFLALCARHSRMVRAGRVLAQASVVFASMFCDWGIAAPAGVMVFDSAMSGGTVDRRKAFGGFLLMGAIPAAMGILGAEGGVSAAGLAWHVAGCAAPALAGVACLWMYRPSRGRAGRAEQYLFYFFYPAHLAVLCAIRALAA